MKSGLYPVKGKEKNILLARMKWLGDAQPWYYGEKTTYYTSAIENDWFLTGIVNDGTGEWTVTTRDRYSYISGSCNLTQGSNDCSFAIYQTSPNTFKVVAWRSGAKNNCSALSMYFDMILKG